MSNIIENIKAITNKSLSQIEQDCGIGTNGMYRWDKNSPSIESVAKVAEYLNVSIDYIFYGKDKSNQTNSDNSDFVDVLDNPKPFKAVLSSLMQLNGITAYKLAKMINVSIQTITNWLNNNLPNAEYLPLLAKIFGCDYNYLLSGKGSAPDKIIFPDKRNKQKVKSYSSFDLSSASQVEAVSVAVANQRLANGYKIIGTTQRNTQNNVVETLFIVAK